jgi:hypothetical protein
MLRPDACELRVRIRLARSSVALALGCMAHNLMKWKAREAARAMRLAA